jgi:hypothetical protein
LGTELREVLNRYARDVVRAPSGSNDRVVQIQLAMFPSPHPEDTPEEAPEGGKEL